jgi:hypothetical protein
MSSASVARRVAAPALDAGTGEVEPAPAPTPAAAPSPGSDPATALKDALTAIAAWIPSEALGIYTVGYGILLMGRAPDNDSLTLPPLSFRWLIFWLAFVMSVLFLVFQAEKARRDSIIAGKVAAPDWKKGYFGRLAASVGLTTVAMVLYIASTPGNPFVQPDGPFNPTVVAIVTIFAAAALPIVAWLLGITKPKASV